MSISILSHIPANGALSVPVGVALELLFDTKLDNVSLVENTFLVTSGKEQFTGPWAPQTFERPDINDVFDEPAYNGIVRCKSRIEYYDQSNVLLGTRPSDFGQTSPVAITYRTKLILTPERELAPNTLHTLYSLGTSSSVGTSFGVRARDVFDPRPDGSNSTAGTSTELVYSQGPFLGTSNGTFFVELMANGVIGTSKYRWRWNGGTWSNQRPTHGRFLPLQSGVAVSFDRGATFASGDIFSIYCQDSERMASSLVATFITGAAGTPFTPPSNRTDISEGPPAYVPTAGVPGAFAPFQVRYMIPHQFQVGISSSQSSFVFVFTEGLSATSLDTNGIQVTLSAPTGDPCVRSSTTYVPNHVTASGSSLTVYLLNT